MGIKTMVGSSNFVILVEELGGGVTIYKEGVSYWKGQWIPGINRLILPNFPFEEIMKRFEFIISEAKLNVCFPYYGDVV